MAKYHVNPATGVPGRCAATNGGCPFNDVSDHFDSAVEARVGYEQEMEAREKYEKLRGLGRDLVKTTLKLRAELDERMKHTAGDPEWAEIKERVAAAKAKHERVLERAARQGLNPKDLILGVDDKGGIFNKAQLWRVRLHNDSEYSRMAGVPLRVGSDLPMPGDDVIARDQAKWEKDKVELEKLAPGSPERRAARVALVKRVVRDMPTKYALDRMERTGLTDVEEGQVLRGQAVHKAMEKQRSAGLQNGEEAGVYIERSFKAGQDFIDSLT